MNMILEKILATKKTEVSQLRDKMSIDRLKKEAMNAPPARDFKAALRHGDCAIIAEVKRRSPSGGDLRPAADPAQIAAVYEKSGAAAVSVLTDNEYFGGHKRDIVAVRNTVRLPILRKDFIIDPCQVYETKAMGADALLLIARILKDRELRKLIHLTGMLGLTPVVEIHAREELKKALRAGAEVIGINNRDLSTFKTDLRTTLDLAPLIPTDRVVISASGIHERKHIRLLADAGVRAFLIGETLMKSPGIGEKLRELLGHDGN
jgi:indole-3-glycerol phosphate synthase